MEELTKKLGIQIEKQLPKDVKFVLLLAKKESGKCATNITGRLLPTYLRICADSFDGKVGEITFIEITTK